LDEFPTVCFKKCFKWWCDHWLTVWSANETKLKWWCDHWLTIWSANETKIKWTILIRR
jgi:hypothetical protein